MNITRHTSSGTEEVPLCMARVRFKDPSMNGHQPKHPSRHSDNTWKCKHCSQHITLNSKGNWELYK